MFVSFMLYINCDDLRVSIFCEMTQQNPEISQIRNWIPCFFDVVEFSNFIKA